MNADSRKNITIQEIFWVLYCFVYIALTILPSLKYSVSYIMAGSFGLFAVFLFFIKNYEYRKLIVFLAVWGTMVGFLSYILNNSDANNIINTPINYLRYILPALLLTQVKEMSKRAQWILWLISVITLIYVASKTLTAVEENPMIARVLASGSTDASLTAYRLMNIGGFEVCYAIGLTFTVWIALFFDCRKVFLKIIFFILAIASFYFVIKVQYMTLLLLCLLSVLIILFNRPGNLIAKCIGVVIALIMLISMSSILRWIADLGVEAQIYSKLINMANFFDGSSTISQTTSRAGLYGSAFLEFLSSPIWGKYNAQHAAASHSTILGIVCTTGIIGLMAYIYLVKNCYKLTKNTLAESDMDVTTYRVSFIAFLALLVLNPIQYSYEIAFIIFMFIPLTIILFDEYIIGGGNNNELMGD